MDRPPGPRQVTGRAVFSVLAQSVHFTLSVDLIGGWVGSVL